MAYPFRDAFHNIDPLRYPPAYIDEQVRTGNWRCWGDDRAAILAEIKTYPSGIKEVQGIAAAGDLAAIPDLIPLAEQWGRENGCIGAEIDSSPAWARLLDGYRVTSVRVWKDL